MVATKKNALGRGLGALMGDTGNNEEKNTGIHLIDIDKIDVNPFQPRTNFDEETLKELSTSISELGVIQPITLRETDEGRYQIISGERRTRASKMAGLTEIPAYVRLADDQGMLEMSLVENIQREDLDAIEIAISYNRLIEECNLTQVVLSERVGKKRSTVTNYLRLLKLPAEIQMGIRNREISMGHARSLVGIEDLKAQINIYKQIIKNDLSVRNTEEMVRKLFSEENIDSKKKAVKKTSSEYKQLQQHLSKYFDSNVSFKRVENGKGQIIIPFKSDNDLERIIGIIDKLNK